MSADSSSPTEKAYVSYASSLISSVLPGETETLQRDDFRKMLCATPSDLPGPNRRVKNVGVETMDHLNDSTVSGCLGPLSVHMRTTSGLDQCLYDLLESTRVAHRKCNVLDRDIGTGIIMSRNSVVPSPVARITPEAISNERIDHDKPEELLAVFCGSRYLLGDTADRSSTKTLLIDIEGEKILEPKQDKPRLPRTGTVRFTARAIRKGRLLGNGAIMPLFISPPDISKTIFTRYKGIFPDRVTRFACKTPMHRPGYIEDPSSTVARHALRHDAESVYWLLMWWAMCAAPSGNDATLIQNLVWGVLTENLHDYRPLSLKDHDLDPSYAALLSLLNKLGTFLMHDLYWATEAPYNHSEFLHEAFQRIIFNFLVDNENEDFMLLPKSGVPRGHTNPPVWAEPTESRHQYLLRTSGTGNSGSSQKRGASSQGELERGAKKTTSQIASSSTGTTTRS